MNRLKTFLPLIIILALIGLLWFGLHSNPHKINSPLIGKAAPVFEAPRLKYPKQMITNHIFKGHVSVLNVFASWCISCKIEHDTWMGLDTLYPNLAIYGLNFKDKREKVLAWLKKQGDPYRLVIFDPKGNIGINYGVYGTPETFVIDKKGIIRYKTIGPVSPDKLREKILPEIKSLKDRA